MSDLALRREPPDNPRDERYAVMVGETYVGAIILAPGARDAPLWTWSISAVPRLREAKYNTRKVTDGERTARGIGRIEGKRLMYRPKAVR